MFGLVNYGAIYTTAEKEQQEIGLDFVKIKTWTVNGPSNVHIVPDFENGTITINKKGTFVISASLSFRGTNERVYTAAMFTNGVEAPVQIKKYFGPNLKTDDLTATGIIKIDNVPAVLDIRIKCDIDDANVCIMLGAQFSIFQIISSPDGGD